MPRLIHREEIEMRLVALQHAGVLEKWGQHVIEALGPPVYLVRKLRDGAVTQEFDFEWFAQLTLQAIPECEPLVERAMIWRKALAECPLMQEERGKDSG
jgi:hypothetical protein